MTKDEVIALARKAEGEEQQHGMWRMHVEDLERFAALVSALTAVTPAQIIHADAAAHEFDAIQLLRLCHTYLRGAEIRLPGGCRPLDRDKLAREINQFLNKQNEEEAWKS
jgi:hypothetical protein